MAELCRRYGVSRRIGYKWVDRYVAEGVDGLQDRSRANLGKLAEHDRYLVHREPDGTLIWEPAEVMSVTELHSGIASNVIPARAEATVNFRYAPDRTAESAASHISDLLGDGVFAFFGAPIAHQDDAKRAVVAALGLQKAISEMTFDDLSGMRLRTGVGVSTGEAIAGNIGSSRRMHYSVIGDPVNLAARLQVAAAPGQILADDATHRVVRDIVISEDLGPLGSAGKGDSPHMFQIVALKPPTLA